MALPRAPRAETLSGAVFWARLVRQIEIRGKQGAS